MRALLCRNGLHLDTSYPDPAPPPGEALVRVRLAGICNTDLELVRGYMAFQGVLGHEFVGEVVQGPDPTWIGRRVVGDINAACYACPTCRAGRHTHCPNRTTLGIFGRDGALADYLTLPQANLYAVPDAIPDEMAVFTEPLAAACEILEQVKLSSGDRVVVLGDGKLGLLVAAVLRLTGCDLLLAGRHADKLALAEAWGVPVHLVDGSLPEHRADVVVECTGSPAGFAEALRLLRPRGDAGAEEHLSWPSVRRHECPGGERDHAGRFALRAVRRGLAPDGGRPGRSTPVDLGDFLAGRGRAGVCARGCPRRAEGSAGNLTRSFPLCLRHFDKTGSTGYHGDA